KDRLREYKQKYWAKVKLTDPVRFKEFQRKQYERYKEQIKRRARNWEKANIVHVAELRRAVAYRLKLRVFAMLGDKCSRCGFDDDRALQVDHIYGQKEPRGSKLRSGGKLYRAIVKGLRDIHEFQLLCANCNSIKAFENGEYKGKHKAVSTCPTYVTEVLARVNSYKEPLNDT